jgi:hypothetical protein
MFAVLDPATPRRGLGRFSGFTGWNKTRKGRPHKLLILKKGLGRELCAQIVVSALARIGGFADGAEDAHVDTAGVQRGNRGLRRRLR